LVDKVATVPEAVRRLVHDSDYLAIGGFGCDRIPTAVLHEILRQGKQNLRFAGHTATHDFQILCAGNLMGRGKTLAAVDIAYVVGLEARGLSPHARRVLESGDIACTSGPTMPWRCASRPRPWGCPFCPRAPCWAPIPFARAAPGRLPVLSPGSVYWRCPPCYPDVAAIHVHEADRFGNCRIRGTTVADLDLARAAKHLIITCERLIPNDAVRCDPTQTVIPFFCVRCRLRSFRTAAIRATCPMNISR